MFFPFIMLSIIFLIVIDEMVMACCQRRIGPLNLGFYGIFIAVFYNYSSIIIIALCSPVNSSFILYSIVNSILLLFLVDISPTFYSSCSLVILFYYYSYYFIIMSSFNYINSLLNCLFVEHSSSSCGITPAFNHYGYGLGLLYFYYLMSSSLVIHSIGLITSNCIRSSSSYAAMYALYPLGNANTSVIVPAEHLQLFVNGLLNPNWIWFKRMKKLLGRARVNVLAKFNKATTGNGPGPKRPRYSFSWIFNSNQYSLGITIMYSIIAKHPIIDINDCGSSYYVIFKYSFIRLNLDIITKNPRCSSLQQLKAIIAMFKHGAERNRDD